MANQQARHVDHARVARRDREASIGELIVERRGALTKAGLSIIGDHILWGLSGGYIREHVILRCVCGCRRRLMRLEPAESYLYKCEICSTVLTSVLFPTKGGNVYRLLPVVPH
jgi:hypothetical protein